MYEIDKNTPLPKKRVFRACKYPWRDMQIGDSFLSPLPVCSMSSAVSTAKKRTGFRFVTRSVEGGTRVWRVK